MCLETLLSATIKNKQFYAIDFAKLAPFSYIPQLNQSNFNLSLFAYGSIKHLLCLSNGTLPAVSKAEFNSRLQHILNVLEIVCLESNLQEFHSYSWSIAKQYDIRILKDIEQSFKSWETLDKSIDSSAWNFAIRMVPPVKNQNLNQKSQIQIQILKKCVPLGTLSNKMAAHTNLRTQVRAVFIFTSVLHALRGVFLIENINL